MSLILIAMIFSLITALNDGQTVNYVMASNTSDVDMSWWVSLLNRFHHIPSSFVNKGLLNGFTYYLCHFTISAFNITAADVTVVCASIVSFTNLIINDYIA
jgi:hypothetical protein